MADGRKVEAAMRRGVRKALIRHIQMGLPVVEWRDGKTVYVYPEELKELVRSMDGKERRRAPKRGQRGRR
jgi:uncharacterized protein (UPF0216 family)